MKKYDFYNDSIKNLALISCVYALFINANNSIEFIHDLFNGKDSSFGFMRWIFGLMMVFIISWITLLFNLHIIPRLVMMNKKYGRLKSILCNAFLYASFVLIFIFAANKFYIVNSRRFLPDIFGWTVVYFISLLIFSAIKHQRKSKHEQKEKEILKTEKLRSELNEIKTVINPHFLFNSLNTLNALINIDSVKASKFTTHLSRLYRYILSHRNKDLITIKEELFFINDYVQLIKIRYKDCFNIEVNIKKEHQHCLIPPLSLQLLIENAEKHNAFTESTPLLIRIYIENDFLVVTHPLMERPSNNNSMGNGLSSLTKRCRILFKRDLFIIKNQNFTVKVPIGNRAQYLQ